MIELDVIQSKKGEILRSTQRCISTAAEVMELLRKEVDDNPFKSVEEEVAFFKVVKPAFWSHIVYYTKLHIIESRKPSGSQKLRQEYFEKELNKIDYFFLNNQEFCQYYNSNSTFLDDKYFIRGNLDFLLSVDFLNIFPDHNFSTGYDFLVSKILAYERVSRYIENSIQSVKDDGNAESVTYEKADASSGGNFVQTSLGSKELYVLLKSFIDSDAVLNHTYKSFFELIVPKIANKQSKGFSPTTLLKQSDKVDYETRENVKRILQKMIRNIDNY